MPSDPMENRAPDPAQNQRLRRHWLIYPQFQMWLLVINTLITVTCFLLVAFQVARSFATLRSMGMAENLGPTHAYFKFLDYQAMTLYSNLAVAVGLGLVASALFTLVFSHRLAGPIVRMTKYFEKIVRSGLKPDEKLQFRDGDFFGDLPPLVNGAFEVIRRGTGQASGAASGGSAVGPQGAKQTSDPKIKRVA